MGNGKYGGGVKKLQNLSYKRLNHGNIIYHVVIIVHDSVFHI